MASEVVNLCAELRVIYEYEIAHGNVVASVAAPAGTQCDYAIAFREPLKSWGAAEARSLPDAVRRWECNDTHYALEAGFYCSEHRHSVAGPIAT